jgi:ribose transport system substrate-binding protein
MKHRLTSPLLALAAFSLLLTGCPQNKTGEKDGKNAKSGGQTKLAFITNNANEFWTLAQRGSEDAAKKENVALEFKMPSPGTSEEQQRIIQDLLSKGIQGIAISANDAENIAGFLKRDVASKVPLITQDNDVPDPTARRCYLGTHNYRAGRAAGELVLKHAPEGGKLAIFVGQMDAQNAVERRQGVIDVLLGIDQKDMKDRTPLEANQKVGKFTLVDTYTDEAKEDKCQQRAQDALTKHPDMACMVGLWAYNPPAMLRAVKQSKLDKAPVIVGFDEDYQTLDAIQKGDIVGTIVQNPYEFGYQSIRILKAFADGNNDFLKKEYPSIDAQNRIYIDHRVIAKNNVDEFYTNLKKLRGK